MSCCGLRGGMVLSEYLLRYGELHWAFADPFQKFASKQLFLKPATDKFLKGFSVNGCFPN